MRQVIWLLCVFLLCGCSKTLEIQGKITESPRGDNGFGFDEIFELEDGRTYAELSKEEKNQISHRRLALQDLLIKLENHI